MKKVIIDGNSACAHIAYLMNEQAFIYPITPSSTISELCDSMCASGEKNIFNSTMKVSEMQSEAGVAGAVHGALSAGSLTTTFTSSQGLLLMLPNMYKIAGELLPSVFYVASRSLATHALNIFCDHSDIYSCLKTGFNIIACSSVQEVNDMAIACQLSALKSETPFICFFDGFRTSHELCSIEQTTLEEIKSIVDFEDLEKFKAKALNNVAPFAKGTSQNPDVFFQNRLAGLKFYKNIPQYVKESFEKLTKIMDRKYDTIEYFGDPNAKDVIVAMGSAVDTIKLATKNLKHVGVIKIRLLKPFDDKTFIEKLPKSCKNITILERNLDMNGADSLKCFVQNALFNLNRKIKIFSGVYGLGGKEFTPDDAIACFENMRDTKKEFFTVGVYDNVTNTSLQVKPNYVEEDLKFSCKIYGFGSDGSVSSSKNILKLIGDKTNNHVQGYFDYDSKKSGSLTISHLRVDQNKLEKPFNPQSVNLVMCNNPSFITKFDMTSSLKKNGIFIINCNYSQDELDKIMPNNMKNDILEKNIKVYTIDANSIANNYNLGAKINTIMQTALFKVANILPFKTAVEQTKKLIVASYSKKGDEVVNNNINAILEVQKNINLVSSNFNLSDEPIKPTSTNDYYEDIIKPINRQEGNFIPVSKFSPDGRMPTNTSKLEKRGIASQIPEWIPENCIQCGRCVMACPHACLKAKEFSENSELKSSKAFLTRNNYKIQVSPLDCTGCGVCAEVCPAKNKAIKMNNSLEFRDKETENYETFEKIKATNPVKENTVKSLQYSPSYFEFSGACAGCGETPYLKLVTKMFGDRMIVANATGCSSIYGGTFPSCPYSKDAEGFGPAWANSLFEDNAEFGYGIYLAKKAKREQFIDYLRKKVNTFSRTIKEIIKTFLTDTDNHERNKEIVSRLKFYKCTHIVDLSDAKVFENMSLIIKPSVWIIGGDGWAFDIGFGGLDHIVASNENVNILILDTEVYSNTGGQSSKSTPRGASAKFNVAGKTTMKKDILGMFSHYKNVYLASVSMGANPDQCVKAFAEAENFDGPSVILAYSPCINHGYDMKNSQTHASNAVKSGYATLFRYNPNLSEPMQIDSGEPTMEFNEFLNQENRFRILSKTNSENKDELNLKCKNDAKDRCENLRNLKNKDSAE